MWDQLLVQGLHAKCFAGFFFQELSTVLLWGGGGERKRGDFILQRFHKYWMGSLPAHPPPLPALCCAVGSQRRVLTGWRVPSKLCNVWPVARTAARRQDRDSLLHMEKCFGKRDAMRMRRGGSGGGERKTTKVVLTVNKRTRFDAENGGFF